MPLTEWRLKNIMYIYSYIYIHMVACTPDTIHSRMWYTWTHCSGIYQHHYGNAYMLYAGSRNSFVYPGADVICAMGVISWWYLMCQLQSIDIYWRICMSKYQLIVNAILSCWFGLSFYPSLLWNVISRLEDRGLKLILKPPIKCYDFVNTIENTICNMYTTLWQDQSAKFICD